MNVSRGAPFIHVYTRSLLNFHFRLLSSRVDISIYDYFCAANNFTVLSTTLSRILHVLDRKKSFANKLELVKRSKFLPLRKS